MTGNQTSTTRSEAAPPESTPTGPASASRRRILIVEDNETARKQIQIFLETDASVIVDTAANGSDALKALTERPYSVIVTDLKMPRVDGLQLLEEVQKRQLPADVIITTGFGTIDHAVQAMRHGGRRLPDQADQPRAPAAGDPAGLARAGLAGRSRRPCARSCTSNSCSTAS